MLSSKIYKGRNIKCMVHRLMKNRVFGIFGETHCRKGRENVYSPPEDCIPFWSHGSSKQAGILVLMSYAFLDRFKSFHWEEIDPRRVTVLRLAGPEGALDIWAVYLWTGCKQQERKEQMHKIASNMTKDERVMTIIAGIGIHCR